MAVPRTGVPAGRKVAVCGAAAACAIFATPGTAQGIVHLARPPRATALTAAPLSAPVSVVALMQALTFWPWFLGSPALSPSRSSLPSAPWRLILTLCSRSALEHQ